MNHPELIALASFLENEPENPSFHFELDTWLAKEPCGTVGCIAGAYLVMRDKVGSWLANEISPATYVREALNLPPHIAWDLFAPSFKRMVYRSVTSEQAAQAVRNVAAGAEGAQIWSHVEEINT